MELEQYRQAGETLERLMKLRTHPIAVKWFEKLEDVPEGAVVPSRDLGKRMAFCQTTALTRMRGMTIAMTKHDHRCWNPLVGFGNVPCEPGSESFEEVLKYLGIADHDKASAFFAAFPRLPQGKYEAVVTAPLAKVTFEPDVVMVYGDTAQINHLIRCVKGVTGAYVKSEFDGIDSCIYATVCPFQSGEYRVTFPDPGDRERARAGDDEVILSFPAGKLAELVPEVVASDSRGMGHDFSRMELDFDFWRPPFYETLFKMWGLE